MTERERWVVYPLLFLALGAALRDKLVDRTTTKSIVCQELTIVEDEPDGYQTPRVLAKIGRTKTSASAPAIGYLVINGEVDVEGMVKVNGVVNAKQYAYQDLLLAPVIQQLLGIPIPGMQAPPTRKMPNAPDANSQRSQPKTKPPAEATHSGANSAPAKSNTDEGAPPKK